MNESRQVQTIESEKSKSSSINRASIYFNYKIQSKIFLEMMEMMIDFLHTAYSRIENIVYWKYTGWVILIYGPEYLPNYGIYKKMV